MSLPAIQRWMGRVTAARLSEEIGTPVSIGNLRLGLFNRLVADDVLLLDQQGDTLLFATRLGTKIHLGPLFSGKIRLASVQLFGFDVNIRKTAEDAPYNFQYIIDKLSDPDKDEPSTLDLAISTAVARRGTIRHDLTYKPRKNQFDTSHLSLENFSLKASLKELTNNKCKLVLSHLSFTETNINLIVKDILFDAFVSDDALDIEDFSLLLPNTVINIPSLSARFNSNDITYSSFDLDSEMTLADIQALVPQLKDYTDVLSLKAKCDYSGKTFDITSLELDGSDVSLRCNAKAETVNEDLLLSHFQLPHNFAAELHLTSLDISELALNKWLPMFASLPLKLSSLGDIHAEGEFGARVDSTLTDASIDCKLITAIGNLTANGHFSGKDHFSVDVTTSDLTPTLLLTENNTPWYIPERISISSQIEGSLQQQSARGTVEISNMEIIGRSIQKLLLNVDLQARQAIVKASMKEPKYTFELNADFHNKLDFWDDPDIINNISGNLELSDVAIHDPSVELDMQHLALNIDNELPHRSLRLQSDFMDVTTDGEYDFRSLLQSAQLLSHSVLPALIPVPSQLPKLSENDIQFDITLRNPDQLLTLSGIDISVPKSGHIKGSLSVPERRMELQATIPQVLYGSEDLQDISLHFSELHDSLQIALQMHRTVQSGTANLTLAAEGYNNRLLSELVWDVQSTPVIRGTITADTRFRRDLGNELAADINILPTNISIGDTIWHVDNSTINLQREVLTVNNLQVEQGDCFLRIGGKASANESDKLWVELQDISLGYILSFVRIGDVDLDAKVSGSVLAHHLFARPVIEANVLARELSVNGFIVGDTRARGGWERHAANTIDIDAYITDPATDRVSHATCLIRPGGQKTGGIDLTVDANHLSAAFIERYTHSIFNKLIASVSGRVRLYGPFSELDLDGDVRLDTAALTIPTLGTRYHLSHEDIKLRPGSIEVNNVTIHDRSHITRRATHSAQLSGKLMFEHFRDMRYDFSVTANDMLCYDFNDFGDMPFYATIFASGTAQIEGNMGRLQIDLQGHPTSGSVLTYNASSPEATTNSQFVTFVTHDDDLVYVSQPTSTTADEPATVANDEQTSVDMRINFNIDVRPEATLRLLMDQRTGDMISLHGNGNILASYHNKGAFQMYGVYHVDRGTYRLSMQDLIRKEFVFQQGGSITFGGQPMKAALDLQAVYTVPSVSLNDLTTGNSISNSTVRVNCLMNIGGLAEQPHITFDFDIPNVNEDEKQMVRSLISTEEERNLQVIYLLGIGRFYTYDYSADLNRTNTAMNGLLSSTISGQLNTILSNVIGNNASWNFGTNLSTGQQGWNEVDVEGMLSGRLLNNRLLFNGTFGYRDRPMTAGNTNFVGDFDLQYLLTPSGNIRLKAYSETNDRYFTKSALTTQGVGILWRKDFNHLGDLFRRNK
ncbi:MAG: translocation/assembly module TamB [Bacteroidaceae bacterium]|nr:translocation/assembly module TamB [Bacteroidaceae bacterium]